MGRGNISKREKNEEEEEEEGGGGGGAFSVFLFLSFRRGPAHTLTAVWDRVEIHTHLHVADSTLLK